MRVNVNHPSFISFLENVTTNIKKGVVIDSYFTLPQETKISLQYTVLKLMKNSIKVRAVLSNDELRSFVTLLWKKNEESENYELAAILNDISSNFDKINDVTRPKKRTIRKIKTDT